MSGQIHADGDGSEEHQRCDEQRYPGAAGQHCYPQGNPQEKGEVPQRFLNGAKALAQLYDAEIVPAVAQGIRATVYTPLSAVAEEMNGFVTYDRAVEKLPAEVMAAANEKIYAAMRACSRKEDA